MVFLPLVAITSSIGTASRCRSTWNDCIAEYSAAEGGQAECSTSEQSMVEAEQGDSLPTGQLTAPASTQADSQPRATRCGCEGGADSKAAGRPCGGQAGRPRCRMTLDPGTPGTLDWPPTHPHP